MILCCLLATPFPLLFLPQCDITALRPCLLEVPPYLGQLGRDPLMDYKYGVVSAWLFRFLLGEIKGEERGVVDGTHVKSLEAHPHVDVINGEEMDPAGHQFQTLGQGARIDYTTPTGICGVQPLIKAFWNEVLKGFIPDGLGCTNDVPHHEAPQALGSTSLLQLLVEVVQQGWRSNQHVVIAFENKVGAGADLG